MVDYTVCPVLDFGVSANQLSAVMLILYKLLCFNLIFFHICATALYLTTTIKHGTIHPTQNGGSDMNISERILRAEERVSLELREIYAKNGYAPYYMSKFEEYDLYAKNRAFLRGEEIITFNDTAGHLMALKPDVTLSIVKNYSGEGRLHKVYYNENVYRVAGETKEFREIMQSGLECIGDIDLFQVCEVLSIASQSLKILGKESILAISHMGLLTGFLDEAELTAEDKSAILACISAKNEHSLREKCNNIGVDMALTDKLAALAGLYAPLPESIDILKKLSVNSQTNAAVQELSEISSALSSVSIMVDFSLVNDMSYYNGVIFQGFVSGSPEAVLSGGRYDKLLERFSKSGGAIGFAVYLDQIARVLSERYELDVDVLLIYNDSTKTEAVLAKVEEIRKSGKSVRVQAEDSGNIRYGERIEV